MHHVPPLVEHAGHDLPHPPAYFASFAGIGLNFLAGAGMCLRRCQCTSTSKCIVAFFDKHTGIPATSIAAFYGKCEFSPIVQSIAAFHNKDKSTRPLSRSGWLNNRRERYNFLFLYHETYYVIYVELLKKTVKWTKVNNTIRAMFYVMTTCRVKAAFPPPLPSPPFCLVWPECTHCRTADCIHTGIVLQHRGVKQRPKTRRERQQTLVTSDRKKRSEKWAVWKRGA